MKESKEDKQPNNATEFKPMDLIHNECKNPLEIGLYKKHKKEWQKLRRYLFAKL